ncbi:hypothetical protein PBY51_024199 [Eleginops maclovinus]|uniref:MARVEL domain-containing protein n=1 Tax=Eleginops maclovinus TaxID=56733 RepID=A0AAN7XYZ5_ELEMC|nr:hypothetical protein PBY51_024199 [Eleginops maclovinus]
MSQPPRSNRGHRERNGEHRNRESNDDRSSSRPPYYPREVDSPPKHVREREVPRVEHHESKCSHICSRRGIMLICAVLTNSLVLICLVAAHMGTELQKARELDMQYSQMRAPGLYGGVPFSLTLGVLSLLFVVAGNKPPHHMSRKLLYGSLVFQAVGAVAYVVAVGLYLHFIIRVNSTDVCQQRARIYAGRGYTWMNCDVGGADAAVALFGLITAILYAAGTVLTFQTIRGVRRYLEERKRREADKRQARSNAQRAPLRADTTSV